MDKRIPNALFAAFLGLAAWCVLSACLLASCAEPEPTRLTKYQSGDTRASYDRSAKGTLTAALAGATQVVENSFELKWTEQFETDVRSGSGWYICQPDVTGTGSFSWRDANGPQYETCRYVFTGKISLDGSTLEGTVHVTGEAYSENGPVPEDFLASWRAARSGDYIEGVIEGLLPFKLKVQPFASEK
jgi:hypothetical protein